MSIYLRNIFRFVFFILIQVLLLNKIPLNWSSVPYIPFIYTLFLLLLPITTSVPALLIIGFLTGLTMDTFMNTGGIHAFACVLMVFARTRILSMLLPEKFKEYKSKTPGTHTLGWTSFLSYSTILILLHSFIYTFLEVWSSGSILYVLSKTFFITLTTMIFVIIYLLLFSKSIKYAD